MFNKLFNVKNPFWQSMNTIFDLFVLNVLWLIGCIPIVTIGLSTTAAFYALIQRARQEDTSIYKDFIHSYKQNLKPGLILGILLTLVGGFLVSDIYLCRVSGKGIFTFFMFFFAVLFIFWAFTTLYAYPILAKFERKTSEILIWAFTLSIKNITMTLTMMFLIVAGIWMCRIIPGLIFIMFGLIAQFCSTIFASIFKPYLPKPWYMEDDEWQAEHPSQDNSYADFDEAAFYGYDPKEVEKMMQEDTDYEK